MEAFEILRTYDDFEQLLMKKLQKPILLNVSSQGCPNCTSLAAERAIATKYWQTLVLVKMSADTVPELEMKLGIDLVPTLLLRTGETERRFVSTPDPRGANVLRWLDQEMKSSGYQVMPVGQGSKGRSAA